MVQQLRSMETITYNSCLMFENHLFVVLNEFWRHLVDLWRAPYRRQCRNLMSSTYSVASYYSQPEVLNHAPLPRQFVCLLAFERLLKGAIQMFRDKTYICIHRCTHTGTHTYYTHIYTDIHTHIRTFIHTYMPTYNVIHTHKYTLTYIQTYVHICRHTYMPTYNPWYYF